MSNESALVGPPPPRSLLGRALLPVFGRVGVSPETTERLREAHAQGVVVHVLRSKRVVDPLFIQHALARLGLPRPAWMHDHAASERPPTAQALAEAVEAGQSALLFLRRPVTLVSPSGAYSERHVEALLAAQRRMSRPILLLPETLLWTKRAVGLRRTIIDTVFGDREAPGQLRELLGFLWQSDGSRYYVGTPVNLMAVLEREAGQSDAVIAKKIRWSILHHLSREEAVRAGPMRRSAARTRQMVLKDAAVRRLIAEKAPQSEDAAALEAKADEMVRAIAADVRYGWLRVLDVVIDRIWHRIYDGIVVDADGLERVRTAARRGPVVLVPSHKSHIDYLVLSQVFFKQGLMPPHIAAGENLNFPPMGLIFRRSGAFFIRRSFKGDKLYATVFAAYVRRLLKEGHALEFFIEGGRSRTGKLLTPKLGMLSMCVEPVLDGSISDVSFVPVSIGYERVIEARSYAHELGGGAKKKEDVGALLSSAGVLLSRYGRVYVDFDEPISLRVFAASRGFPLGEAAPRPSAPEGSEPASVGDAPAARSVINQLGHRIVYGINRVTRVTPTSLAALVLLSHARRGMAESELLERAERLSGFLVELGARLSGSITSGHLREAVKQAIARLASDDTLETVRSPDGETIIRLDDDARRALDYYKNNVLHYVVPCAIVAASVLAHGGEAPAPRASVTATAREMSRALKLEFSFRSDDFDANFAAAAERLIARRTLEEGAEGWSVTLAGRGEAMEIAGTIAVFFEAYRATAEVAASELDSGPVPEKKLVSRLLLRLRRRALEGTLLRPEGASQITIQSALQLLTEMGAFGRVEGGMRVADEATRQAVIARFASWLAPLA